MAGRQNRLSGETSAYLLQHASNPVDWFPWGDEAFEKAGIENKPVFLSIGYSACHWCHVMAHESFEDEEVATLINKTFVPVKVDREELPHIDNIYMQACQVLTGSGGWPLTVFMTPGRQPFFAATYLPKYSRQGLMGLMELIPLIHKMWIEKKDDVISEASQVNSLVRQSLSVRPGGRLENEILDKAYADLQARYDHEYGGFGAAPKFPIPHHIMFLLRYHRRTGNRDALAMAVKTLERMRAGGMYDQIGYGFHRYSTDREWLVPHFEKMLYDQALLAFAYTEAHQATGHPVFRDTAEEILTYSLKELRTDEGLFAASQDADSEEGEGRYYLWTASEIRDALGEEGYALAEDRFGVREEGNFPEGRDKKLNILHRKPDLSCLPAADDPGTGCSRIDGILEKLQSVRARRTAPSRDMKALTDWNGLMIAALAKAGSVFSRQDFLDAARAAADFILSGLIREDRIFHSYSAGKARFQGGLEDYAFVIWGLIELYGATFIQTYLDAAVRLNSVLIEHFWDRQDLGFHSTSDDDSTPVIRMKTGYDNAIPSGNSVEMYNLLRLSHLTGDPTLRQYAEDTGKAFSRLIGRIPTAYSFLLCALDFLFGPSFHVVIAGDSEKDNTRGMIASVRSRFHPNTVLRIESGGNRMYDSVENTATAYVCSESHCFDPTTDAETMLSYLEPNTLKNPA